MTSDVLGIGRYIFWLKVIRKEREFVRKLECAISKMDPEHRHEGTPLGWIEDVNLLCDIYTTKADKDMAIATKIAQADLEALKSDLKHSMDTF